MTYSEAFEPLAKVSNCHPELVEGYLYVKDFITWFDKLTMT